MEHRFQLHNNDELIYHRSIASVEKMSSAAFGQGLTKITHAATHLSLWEAEPLKSRDTTHGVSVFSGFVTETAPTGKNHEFFS